MPQVIAGKVKREGEDSFSVPQLFELWDVHKGDYEAASLLPSTEDGGAGGPIGYLQMYPFIKTYSIFTLWAHMHRAAIQHVRAVDLFMFDVRPCFD